MQKLQYIIRQNICIYIFTLLVLVHIVANFLNFPTHIQLFIYPVACVYLGSYLANKLEKQSNSYIQPQNQSEEVLNDKDAYMFPIKGSLTLLSLYFLYKFLPTEYINPVLSSYFAILAAICSADILEYPLKQLITKNNQDIIVIDINKKFNLIYFGQKELNINYSLIQLVAIVISSLIAILNLYSPNWLINNIFGIVFSIQGIRSLDIPNFKIGFILLWGLFFYDIFWVYGTDVMVTVAKSIQAPIKLYIPYQWYDDQGALLSEPKLSMLGLGDIVIPGIFLALCLKYDIYRYLKQTKIVKSVNQIKTPYFNYCIFGYMAGIVVCYFVMNYFQHAQPVLLYLVPFCTGSVYLKSLIDGDTFQLFQYQAQEQNKNQQIKDN